MKKTGLLIITLLIFTSCTDNLKTGEGESRSERKVRKQAVSIAEDYAMNQLNTTNKKVTKIGIITISNEQKMYAINPSKILIGKIDDDNQNDAIVSLDTYNLHYQTTSEHLILIQTDGKLKLNRVIESDMSILGLKDRVITAEIHTHSRNSPLFNCSSCKEVVNYQFRSGDLIKIE